SYATTVPTLATDGSADGQHTISVEEQDAAGNISAAASLTFTLDTIAPAAPSLVLAHDSGASSSDRLTSNPTITYTASAAGDTLLYKLDTGSYATTVPTLATDGSADGQHTISVEEQDAAGNISAAASLTFTLDTIAPAQPAAPALADDISHGQNITSDPAILYPTPASGDVLLFSLDGGKFTTDEPAFKTDGTQDGHHTVSVEEQDAAGNISATASLAFTLDAGPGTPAAPRLADDTGLSHTDNVTNDPTITYPTPKPGDVLLYSTDGTHFTSAALSFATDGSADGQHSVWIEEKDAFGISSAPSSFHFTLDTIAPAQPPEPVLADDTSHGQNITSDPTILYPKPAAGDVLLFSFDGGKYTATAPALKADGTQDGQHTIAVAEEDIAGNLSAPSKTLGFTLASSSPDSFFWASTPAEKTAAGIAPVTQFQQFVATEFHQEIAPPLELQHNPGFATALLDLSMILVAPSAHQGPGPSDSSVSPFGHFHLFG
ncbi:MAG: hypothetical protein JO141_17805, partial [Bradyrhizobium sp.]|nr:hypothetical protein [Bradyrhizobium sp.]